MGIDVLGPVRVDEEEGGLRRRDRVVLAALVVKRGEPLSAERIAEALWGDEPPESWAKVVQGCIVRLRRALPSGAIETLPQGYRLAIPADEVDVARFEHLVQRGQQLLTLGEADRASHTLGEALALWRGDPLEDVEAWEAGQIEAARLLELRLDAEETKLDADLEAGHHRTVLSDALALAAAAPLRERRWGLLALAQYQAGRQGDALRSLQRARRVLASELGVDPGPDLVALEQRILAHDPALAAPAEPPTPAATCPYLGLIAYGVEDADLFFGRDAEIASCLRTLTDVGVLAVVGPSGSGKSSLVRAGIGAALQRQGQRPIVVTPGRHPLDAVSAVALGNATHPLILDQAEELFTLSEDAAERARFVEVLVHHAERAPLVLALRADYVKDLAAHPELARLVERGLRLVGAMSEDDLRNAIEGPARQAGWLLEPGLVDLLVREVEGEPGALPLLSHALHRTWEHREGRTLTVAGYQATGGIRGAVAQSAEAVYGEVAAEHRERLRELLLRLVMPSTGGEPVRSRVPRRLLSTGGDDERLIELLVRARLLTSDDGIVELAHESLTRAWPRLQAWLEEDVEGQRILRHVALAADGWEQMGRPESELYRGARLSQALDWQQRVSPALTATEQAFLDASARREQAEAHAAEATRREEVRVARRLRRRFVVTAAAVVLALAAALLAIDQRGDANANARTSSLADLVDSSVAANDTKRDLAALLAIEAWRLDPGPASRSALFRVFTEAPGFVGYIRADDTSGFIAGLVRPGGRTALVADEAGVVRELDLEAMTGTGRRFEGSATGELIEGRMGQSSDGAVVALMVGNRDGHHTLRVYDGDTGTLRFDPAALDLTAGDLAVSPDGRWVVVAGGVDGDAVVLSADDGREVGRVGGARAAGSQRGLNTAAVTFDDGGRLFVATEGGRVRIVDPASAEVIAELPAAGVEGGVSNRLRISPDGSALVGSSDSGELAAWDLKDGSVRWSNAGGFDGPPVDTTCHGLAVSDDQVYCSGVAGSVDTYNLDTGRSTGRQMPLQDGMAYDVVLSDDTATLLEVGVDSPVVGVWRTDGTGPITREVAADRQPIDYLHGGRWLLVGTGRARSVGWLDVWDLTSDELVDPLDDVVDGRPGAEPTWIGALFDDGHAGAYDADAHDRAFSNAPVDPPLVDGTFDPATDRYLLVWADGSRAFSDARTGEILEPTIEDGEVLDAEFTADGSLVVVSEPQGALAVFDTTTGRRVAGPREVEPAYIAVSDELVARTSQTGTVELLDVRTLEPSGAPLLVGPDPVTRLQFSRDGSLLLAKANGGVVRLYDVASRTEIGSGISSLPVEWYSALRPDGLEMAVGSDRGTALWDLDPDRWVEAACRLAGRNLTRSEWDTYIGDLEGYRETCPRR